MSPDDAVFTRPVADLAALGQMLEENRPKLLAMLTRRLGPAVGFLNPEELLNQAFLDAKQKWHNRGRFSTAYAWLYRVALDRLIAEWRRVNRRHELPWPEESSVCLGLSLVDTGTSPAEAAAREELRRRIRQALDLLRDDDRLILWMHHFDHLSFREAGEVLGVTENAATVRHFRALARLRATWLKLYGDDGRPGGGP
jgi:RNA polymerase sigma-70 factor (ECF subfamily)